MKRKILSLIIAVSLLLTNTGVLAPGNAQAFFHENWELPKLELPKIELPKLEWPHFEIPTFTIPGTNITVDPAKGLEGLKEIANVIPDKIDVPGTSFSIYPKESVGGNIVKNILPFVSGMADYLNPAKPFASIARAIISIAKPYFDQWIKPLIPAALKNGAFAVQAQIKNILKLADNPIIQNVFLPVWDFLVGPIDDLIIEIVNLFAEEEKTAPPGSGAGGGGGRGQIEGRPPEVIIPDPFKNQIPIGYFERIDEKGIATGWAVDPNNPAASIKVRMHPVLGQYPNETEANLPYPGLKYPGNHGFSYRIPSGMRDGKQNPLEAYGKDPDEWGVEGELAGPSQKYTLFEPAFGEISSISEAGVVAGWAVDPDRSDVSAEVKIVIDGTPMGSTTANQVLSYFPTDKLGRAPGASKNIGFSFNIDRTKYYDGNRHNVDAYAVNQKDTGEKNEILLANSPFPFMYPATIPIRFAQDPVIVQQGSRVFQTIENIPNQNHSVIVTLDDKKVDINADRHGYPAYENSNDLLVKSDGTGLKNRSVTFDFKTLPTLSLGLHTVTVEAPSYNYLNFNYKGSFKIDVVPYNSIVAETPDILKPGTEFDLLLKSIPHKIQLTGKDANAAVTQVSIGGDREYLWGNVISVNENGDGIAAIRVAIPLEVSRIRKDPGPVQVTVRIGLKTKLAKEEFRVSHEAIDTYFPATTKDGKNPLFIPLCQSTRQPILEITGASGTAHGKASHFSCYSSLTATISGTKAGKAFSVTLPQTIAWEEAAGKTAPMMYYPSETEWDGAISSFELRTTGVWSRDYLGVEEVTVTLKDADGNSASTKINMTSPQQVRIMPLGGKPGDEIDPGEDLWVAWKGFSGNTLNLSIDGEDFRKLYLEGTGGLKKLPSDSTMGYYEGLYLPRWVTPGEHRLLLEDVVNLDDKKKPIYKAETVFKVAGALSVIKDEPKKETTNEQQKKTPDQPVVLQAPVVPQKPVPQLTVSPNPAKAGASITLKMTGFGPLGTVTIYLKGNGKNIKLSGFADYTDSAGALIKQATLGSDLPGGKYTITASDTASLTDTVSLTVEALEPPPPPPEPIKPKPKPKPEPAPEPDPVAVPEAEPVPLPDEDISKPPTCSTGSTYSPTFKSCIEDAPQRSPYDGLPCPPEGTVPSYATQGCIP